jgi:MraZ protein
LFRGVSVLNLDAKGRLAVPARYREEIHAFGSARLTLTVDRDSCVLVYPEPEWIEFERKLKAIPNANPAVRNLQRMYIGNAADVEMDGQGRILLPPHLKAHAGLDKRVAMVGQLNKFELWDEDTWNRLNAQWRNDEQLKALEEEAGIGSLSF